MTEVQSYMSTSCQSGSRVIRAYSDVEKPFIFSDLAVRAFLYSLIWRLEPPNQKIKLDICVQRTRMPPPSALSKMAPRLRYWLLSDNYRSIKADLYNIEETDEEPCRSTRFAFSLQSNLGYEYETNMFLSLPIHIISLNCDLDL